MKLIEPLVAGIRGAENGSVKLLYRGTSTNATYYTDFEFQQQFSASPIALDSNGSAVLYVNALVDVQVRDSNGVLVREFVAGVNATAVEVISQSFTGIDYEDGSSGASKPTTLAAILDAWLVSAGAIDWKVLFNGAPTNLSAAFSSTFFNVKNYGAIGNGVADDRTAIINAQAAAVAVGGGTVFFPPGVYRITNAISLGANTVWLGSGGASSKLAIDSAVSAGAITLPGNPVGSISSISQLWIGAINGVAPGNLIAASAASTGEFHITDCVLCNDALSINPAYFGNATVAGFKIVFTRTYMRNIASNSQLIGHSGSGRLIVRDCDVITTQPTCVALIICDDNGVFEGNVFDASACTVAFTRYITISPTSRGSVVVVGNYFAPNFTIACTAIYNTLAAPNRDCLEYANAFGDMTQTPNGCTPYEYVTDGYSPNITGNYSTGGHQTRNARLEMFAAVVVANQAVNPKAYGTTVIKRTGGVGLTVDANKGSMGDRWVLHVNNTSGGAITVIGGTNVIFDPAAAPLNVNNNGYAEVHLSWLPNGAGSGSWYQTSKAVLS